ncbi:MAG: ABC transporter permease subunit [Acidobacteria bacterium]|nr:ABC transporter permease subunit [Acidobacteriota bacterium]
MRKFRDRMLSVVCTIGILLTVSTLASILIIVAVRGWSALGIDFFTTVLTGSGSSGGVAGHILGTAILVGTAIALAVPVAAGTGILSVFYIRSERAKNLLDVALQSLNGIPSIIFGLVGLALLVRAGGLGKSWLAGGIVLAVMILPTLTVAFIEKLKTISVTTIEAAHGLGLRKSEVVRDVLIPRAAGGLVSGTLLGLARAAGETAPIMFTAAIFSGPAIPHGIRESPVLALPYHIFVLAQDSFDQAASVSMWGAASVLLLMVMTASLMSLPLRVRIHEEARRG